ncbi:PQQ-dependent catabolism-associated beta-propeller protein [Noviherbaspirillum malthae]|uniref:PQQ-dependent catabolism-associated beta-propeller protein n=1 Tax=Noviherbaspirillum malthae TaxID=1260987 RepID=UPI001E49C4EE|nr:PQQ-dependent catabolism-associated beta-propeller protein [Noviherbaspirillum malthae]
MDKKTRKYRHLTAMAAIPAGALAGLLLLAPHVPEWSATGAVFVSSEKDNTITVLDGKTQQQIGLIKTCKRPRHMQFTPDRKRLIAACGDDGAAVVVDVAARKVVDKIALEEGAEIFDLSHDGKTLYFSNEDEAAVVAVDLATKKTTGQIKVGQEPEGVLIAPDGKNLYVTSEVASLVHVIDLGSGKVVKNVAVGKRPRRFALTPDGKELWVTNELGSSVSVIRTSDYTVSHTINFEPKGIRSDQVTPVGMVMSGDGKTAFVTLGRANHVAFVDVESKSVRNMVLVGKRAWGVALTRDNKLLYVANGLSDDVSVVDVAAGRAIKSVKVGRVPHSVAIDD